jgi:hypothetical protein
MNSSSWAPSDVRSPTSSDVRSPTSTSSDVRSPTRTSSEVRSPTSTSTEVRSPTSTSTEVRSPTNTSTEAYTAGNFTATVTGGAGAGANTTVHIYPASQAFPPGDPKFPSHAVQPRATIRELMGETMKDGRPRNTIRELMHETMSGGPKTWELVAVVAAAVGSAALVAVAIKAVRK